MCGEYLRAVRVFLSYYTFFRHRRIVSVRQALIIQMIQRLTADVASVALWSVGMVQEAKERVLMPTRR